MAKITTSCRQREILVV